ncbi:hypothetical protein B4168_1914 [Anoxybacillus flavithermus]|nr:hypothetical protein B4168_1914 [Anoxybacillus flavithermus]OAO85570.1 hypothetical protein GT23_2473 [Parageobacillus thermoglucosidasius]
MEHKYDTYGKRKEESFHQDVLQIPYIPNTKKLGRFPS